MASKIIHKKSAQSGKVPQPSDLEYGEIAINYTDGKMYYKTNTNTISELGGNLEDKAATKEPMGIVDRTASTIAFDNTTRTFSITPNGASFDIYVAGTKFKITSAKTVQIPDTTGLYYFYFNTAGNLAYRTTYFVWETDAMVAYTYWNSTVQAAVYLADERHGVTLDWQTHEYLHRTRGAAFASGFSISNYSLNGDGSADSQAQFDLGGGTFFDEDMQIDIVHSNTPTANTWEQDLQGPSRIPVFYHSGTEWTFDSPTNFAAKAGTARIKYNVLSGNTWTTPDVDSDTWFTSSWIVATNNLNYPVIAVMGQSAHNKIDDQLLLNFSDLNLAGFPSVEFRPLYKIIWKTDSAYTNSIKAVIAYVGDLRSISGAVPSASTVADHGNLAGLADDDHLQYVHITENRTITANHTFSGNVTFGTILPSTVSLQNSVITTHTLTTTATTANQVIASFATNTYGSAEFTIQVINAATGNYQLTKILAVHNGSSVNHTEYGTVVVGTGNASTFSVDYDNNFFRLLCTPMAASSTVFKVTAILSKV